jgi:hypothetical protein
MGTILASAIIDKVEADLEDSSNTTWSATTHLANLNEAMKKIVFYKPDTYIVRSAVALVAGCKQALAVGETGLLEITRNMGSDGLTPGNVITLIEKAVMDAVLPSWMTVTTAAGACLHYMYDTKDPRVFYVYPGRTSSAWYVEMARWSTPINIASGEAITLDDSYEDTIMKFMKARAWEKKRQDLYGAYLRLFLEDLGIRDQREVNDDPNKKPVKGGLP